MGFKKKKTQKNVILSRKERRKQERKQKKVRRNEYYTNRKKPGQFVKKENDEIKEEKVVKKSDSPLKNNKKGKTPKENNASHNLPLTVEQSRLKEKKELKRVKKEMNKNRIQQLKEANEEEDKNIKRLEKQLKLNKRKGKKSMPKSFAADGLDYLLEVCDPENRKNVALAEQQLDNTEDTFEEDLALMTNKDESDQENTEEDDFIENDEDNDVDEEEEDLDEEEDIDDEEDESDITSENYDSEASSVDDTEIEDKKLTKNSKRKNKMAENGKNSKKMKTSDDEDDNNSNYSDDNNEDDIEESDDDNDKKEDTEDGTWTDIYGRLRSKDGAIINKYIPPAMRMRMEDSEDDKKLINLRRNVKGLLNRLAESNMATISKQIEELYMNNSRNHMNSTITKLMLESLITPITTPERLLIEHVVLITILHANVGTEVGAHFLQNIVKKFDDFYKNNETRTVIENKSLDNTINVISQLYNFKLFDSKLIYNILDKLSANFEEKDVECILHILKSVGFTLRKDDPVALKNLIINLQKQAANASDSFKENPRVKFMLDILLAIKNNNVSKIPNYDTTYSEHLKKLLKSFIRKGNYVTQLNISLDDLLNADERGKWWVVGSAWKGTEIEKIPMNTTESQGGSFSQKLLDLAKKQRMNTDTRRNIFCIIMSAEDYLDAFEKLLRLGLKNQQEREIIHVILHCCLQEKKYNPYYAVLAQKFCEYDRRFQMIIKYSIWDKLKGLTECSATQISNLAKMITHLFLEKGLPISILKIVEFSELDKLNLRFMRQVLLGILLHDNLEAIQGVFENITKSEKLKMFRESLRLFISHFLLKNLKGDTIPENQKNLLEQRSKMIESIFNKHF